MSMFRRHEIEKLKLLVSLYEQYVINGSIDQSLIEEVSFDAGYGVFSKTVNEASAKLEKLLVKKMPLREAKAILIKLKSLLK